MFESTCSQGRHHDNQRNAKQPFVFDQSGPDDVLNEVARKWSKFSKRDLTSITTSDQLVDEIVKRYSIKEEAARREVDILMDGRNLGS